MDDNHDFWLLGDLMETDITDFPLDMSSEAFCIFESSDISKDFLDRDIQRFLKRRESIDCRKPDGLIFDRESWWLLDYPYDENSLGRNLESIMKLAFTSIADHATIDGHKFFWSIFFCLTDRVFCKFEDFSILLDDDFIFRISKIKGISHISSEHMRKSVDWNIVLRLQKRDHFFGIFFFRMSSCMDLWFFIMMNLWSLLRYKIEKSLYRALIPRDNRRRKYDRIIFLQSCLARFSRHDAHKCRISLPLSPCTTDRNLVIRKSSCIFHRDDCPRLWSHISKLDRNIDIVIHRATKKDDFTIEFFRCRNDEHHTINNRRKCGSDNTTRSFLKNILHGMDNCWFRNRRTKKMSIGRVWKEGSNSAFPEVFEIFVIRRWAIRKWRFIEFPVTCMDESSDRSLDKQPDRIRDWVIHDKWSNLEIFPDLDRLIASIFSNIWKGCSHICLLELDEFICHRSSIEWRTSPELFHKIVDTSDMINMTMGDTGSDNFFSSTIWKVWNRRINTKLVLVRKLDSHIDDDHLIFIFKTHTVEPYLFHPTKRDNSKSPFRKRLYFFFFFTEKFLECLSRCKKRIRSFWSKRVFEEKWISRTEIGLEFFSRVKKVSWSSFWIGGISRIILKAFISHREYIRLQGIDWNAPDIKF